jgi:hypothetical protein
MNAESFHAGPGVPPGLPEVLDHVFPGARVLGCDPLGSDGGATAATEATWKGAGCGVPLRVCLRTARGENVCVVFRTARADEFGHDRRADRAAQLLLAWDTFNGIPGHVRPIDVGVVAPEGLRSLRDAGEPYLVTMYVDGAPYAEDLRRIAAAGAVEPLDLARLDALLDWLAGLTSRPLDDPRAWRRALRDVVGSGEGIFGILDAYPEGTPGAPEEALQELERLAVAWRWKLRDRDDRLRPIHGDLHPFNVLFDAGTRFTVLDASRGSRGDPADDLTALSVNFVFFALEVPRAWDGLGVLWRRLWERWPALTGDHEALAVAAPYLAWRALVVACPRFYPRVGAGARQRLLALARRALTRGFDPGDAEALFPHDAGPVAEDPVPSLEDPWEPCW